MKNKRSNLILQFLQDYRFNSILVKSFAIIFVLLVCAFSGIMLLVSNKMDTVIEAEVGMMSENSLSKTKDRMDTVMKEVVQISGQLSLDNDIQMFLLPDSENLLNQSQTLAVKKKIEMYSGVFNYIDSIYIYSHKSKYIVTNEGGGDIDDFSDLSWYDNFSTREYEPSRMVSRMKEDNYPFLISYIQPLRLTQMQYLGGIIVNIDVERLDELVVSTIGETEENMLIVDERDNIIFSSKPAQLMKKINILDFYKELDLNNQGYQIIRGEEDDLVVTIEKSDEFKWRYISTVPMSVYQDYQKSFSNFYVLLMVIAIFIAAGFAVVISLYSYTPVKNILSLLKNPDMYEKSFSTDTGLGKDETHEIALNILRNLYYNQQMQDELGEYTTVINKAQIAALQAQISPHFLYNTLENIRWRAIDIYKGENELSQIILNLSEMLRISLDNEHQIITVEEEIENTKLYIEILQLRYEDKLKVEWHVDEEVLPYKIVKVSLQPIIENAVYHGIKPLRKKVGIIVIVVRKTGDSIIIKVTDNGVGMDKETETALNEDLRQKYVMKEGHIGVRNVNQRLKLLMGDEAGVEIRSVAHEETTVTIRLPLTEGNAGVVK